MTLLFGDHARLDRAVSKPGYVASPLHHRLVEVQERARDDGRRRLARPASSAGCGARCLPTLEQPRRGLRDPWRTSPAPPERASRAARAPRAGTPARHEPERVGDPLAPARAALGHRPLGNRARGFDVLRIVQQHERLQRRARALAADRAEQPFGRVEVDRRRRRRRSLPDRVEAAAVQRRRPCPARRSSRCASRAPPTGRAADTDRRSARRSSSTSSPLAASAPSRICSAASRYDGPRASHSFAGSRAQRLRRRRPTTAGTWPT